MSKRRVVFRADGSAQIGLGHVTRSLALAAMLKQDFVLAFAVQKPPVGIREEILRVCETLIELPQSDNYPAEARALAGQHLQPGDLVVLDGYHFETGYQETIRSAGHRMVCIDDIHAFHFVADVVINHAGGMAPEQYAKEPYTRLLLGPAYALLRAPFLEAARSPAFSPALHRVLVNFGGADPSNATLDTVAQLVTQKFFTRIEVLVGNAYQHWDTLQSFVHSFPEVTLHKNLDAGSVAALMRQSGTMVCSPSGVAYEYCSVGGLLFLRATAENQANIQKFLVSAGAAYAYEALGAVLTSEKVPALAGEMVGKQRRHFSGDSPRNCLQVFKGLSVLTEATIRRARPDDLMLLFEWINDPEVRWRSYNTDPVRLEDHKKWFGQKLQQENAALFVVEADRKGIAQIRFDVAGDRAIISYLIDQQYRGKGLGTFILLWGVQALQKEGRDVKEFVGYVKKDNTASCRAFEKAGFKKEEDADVPYPDSYRYVLNVHK